jgi:hypothetical protein
MEGIHERTLIVFTDNSYESLKSSLGISTFPVKIATIQLTMSQDLQNDMDFGTYGYWKLVQVRLWLVLEVIKARIPFLLCEPDALWVRSPLFDPILSSKQELIGFHDNYECPGFGFLRVLPTTMILELFTELERRFTAIIDKNQYLKPTDSMDIAGGEQGILFELLLQRHHTSYKNITLMMLSPTKYTSGKWYDGGRGGDGLVERLACKADGKCICLLYFLHFFRDSQVEKII